MDALEGHAHAPKPNVAGTQFIEQLHPGDSVAFDGVTVQVAAVLSDETLQLKKSLPAPRTGAWASFKVTPRVDQ